MMQPASVAIHTRRPAPSVAVLDIQGELTAASEASVMEAYSPVDGASVKLIVLNFNDLEYMNSSGIGLLVTLLVRINRNGQRLAATGLNEHYRQIFEVTRLSEAIAIFDSEATALAAVPA
jgi:anti-anti-sigma factor